MARTTYTGTNPADGASEITPNDSTDLTLVARALYIGGSGDLKINTPNGDTVTFQDIVAGSLLPVRAVRVYATGTTATNIVALF